MLNRFVLRAKVKRALTGFALAMLASVSTLAPAGPHAAGLRSDPARLSIDVKLLSSDAFEGREPGSSLRQWQLPQCVASC